MSDPSNEEKSLVAHYQECVKKGQDGYALSTMYEAMALTLGGVAEKYNAAARQMVDAYVESKKNDLKEYAALLAAELVKQQTAPKDNTVALKKQLADNKAKWERINKDATDTLAAVADAAKKEELQKKITDLTAKVPPAQQAAEAMLTEIQQLQEKLNSYFSLADTLRQEADEIKKFEDELPGYKPVPQPEAPK